MNNLNYLLKSCFGKPQYKLKDFTIIREVCDDTFNRVKNGRFIYTFLHNNEKVGEMKLKCSVGQIGILWLHPDYRNMGIGQEMVSLAEKATYPDITEMWVVTTPEHSFWMKQHKAKWRNPVHKSVTGYGYVFTRQIY